MDGNTTRFYNTPIYEEDIIYVDFKKFKSKKQALEYCQKLIEQGFLEKKVPYYIERFRDALPKKLLKNKNLRIEKWRKYKFNPNNDILPSEKEEKISEFKVAQ